MIIEAQEEMSKGHDFVHKARQIMRQGKELIAQGEIIIAQAQVWFRKATNGWKETLYDMYLHRRCLIASVAPRATTGCQRHPLSFPLQ